MGKGAETTTKRRRKGRPSLLDIQKRILKQQKLQEGLTGSPDPHHLPDGTPNPSRRSTRRNPSSDGLYPSSEWVSVADDEDDDERIRKKRKPLHGLDPQCPNYAVDSSPTGSGPPGILDSNPRSDNHDPDTGCHKVSVGSEYRVIISSSISEKKCNFFEQIIAGIRPSLWFLQILCRLRYFKENKCVYSRGGVGWIFGFPRESYSIFVAVICWGSGELNEFDSVNFLHVVA